MSSALGCGAYTWTFPPAAAASSAFHTAPSPSPATTTRRPFKSRNTGSAASGVMRAGRVSVGGSFEVISHHGDGLPRSHYTACLAAALAYSAASGMAGRAADNMRFISGTQEPQLVPALQASPTSSARSGACADRRLDALAPDLMADANDRAHRPGSPRRAGPRAARAARHCAISSLETGFSASRLMACSAAGRRTSRPERLSCSTAVRNMPWLASS